MTPRRVITLLTDFGDEDAYAGIMKGVICSIAPEASIVDISHNVPSFMIHTGAYLLWSCYSSFPPGTVHCAVVDPGVGGNRPPVAVEYKKHFFVLPDNGLISMVLADGGRHRSWIITNPDFTAKHISGTFHGRDIFAPAAAHIAAGAKPSDAGPACEVTTSETLMAPFAKHARGAAVTGSIVHIDRFGNYITSIRGKTAARFPTHSAIVSAGKCNIIGISRTYCEKSPGELVAYTGSTGLLEIAVVRGSAADTLRLPHGAPIILRGKPGK